MNDSTPGFPVLHHLPEFAETHVNHLMLFCLLLLLRSVFPSIRVFSNELGLCLRWSKYWSFSISPSNEYSGLISFRIDCFALLVVQGTLKSLHAHALTRKLALELAKDWAKNGNFPLYLNCLQFAPTPVTV